MNAAVLPALVTDGAAMDIPSFLRDVPEIEARRILRSARARRFSRREVVFHEGDLGDTLHIVESGHFMVVAESRAGVPVGLMVLREGDIFGHFATLRSEPRRRATVLSLGGGNTRCIGSSTLLALRVAFPGLTDRLLLEVTAEFDRYMARLIELIAAPSEIRVLQRLVELDELFDSGIRVRQEDLASLAGTSRSTVNRVLREEETRGSVRISRSRIDVLDHEALLKRMATQE